MRGVITLAFDDGYAAVYDHVIPLLNEYKIPGVFALPLDTETLVRATAQPIQPWPDWLLIRDRGHEVAAHGISHQNLTELSGEALQAELEVPAQKLSAATLVYPGGAYSDAVIAEAKKVYTAARTTKYGFELYPPKDPWRLKTVDYTRDNWSLAKANGRVLWAMMAKRWLIETYHLVDISPSALYHSVPFAEFKKHIEFIRTLPIAIQTISQTMGQR